jgi:hypothetical protein
MSFRAGKRIVIKNMDCIFPVLIIIGNINIMAVQYELYKVSTRINVIETHKRYPHLENVSHKVNLPLLP